LFDTGKERNEKMIEPVALLKDLVRINTTNPPGEEEKLLLYLERILQEHRIPYVYQKSAKGRGNTNCKKKRKNSGNQTVMIVLLAALVLGLLVRAWSMGAV